MLSSLCSISLPLVCSSSYLVVSRELSQGRDSGRKDAAELPSKSWDTEIPLKGQIFRFDAELRVHLEGKWRPHHLDPPSTPRLVPTSVAVARASPHPQDDRKKTRCPAVPVVSINS
jgi:hypothetical protein